MNLRAIGQAEAARAFMACAGLDPEGIETPEAAALRGRCFRLDTDTGRLVLSVGPSDGALWCYAAAGDGHGMTAAGLECLEWIAQQCGLGLVGFQTMRRGLIKQARARGYLVTDEIGRGVVMKKVIQ